VAAGDNTPLQPAWSGPLTETSQRPVAAASCGSQSVLPANGDSGPRPVYLAACQRREQTVGARYQLIDGHSGLGLGGGGRRAGGATHDPVVGSETCAVAGDVGPRRGFATLGLHAGRSDRSELLAGKLVGNAIELSLTKDKPHQNWASLRDLFSNLQIALLCGIL
jgi:hypothetical protein